MINQQQHRWGATLDEWHLWAHLTNGGSDLLPAVASPEGQLAPRKETSAIRHLTELHKTPSAWDGGYVRGFSKWALYQATPNELRAWSSMPDYNILLITRDVRAIDIDISNKQLADSIEQMICATLGGQLPVRYRSNSGNRTLLFRTDSPTPLNRRAIIVSHTVKENGAVVSKQQAIELLASGQQTAVAGTHPSGVRFQMRNLDPMVGIPRVSIERLSLVWDQLRQLYHPESKPLIMGDEQAYEFVARSNGTIKNDPILTWLEGEGYVKSYESNGTANIKCPWEHEHTTAGNDNATSWLPRGLGGKERGAFRCLHAHCQDRHTGMFLDRIGYEEARAKAEFASTTLPYTGPVNDGSPSVPPNLSMFRAQPAEGSHYPPNLSMFRAQPAEGSPYPPNLSMFRATVAAAATIGLSAAAMAINVSGGDLSMFQVGGQPPAHTYVVNPPAHLVQPQTVLDTMRGGFPVDLTPPVNSRSSSLTINPNRQVALSTSEEKELRRHAVATMRENGVEFERDEKTGKFAKKAQNLFVALTEFPQQIALRHDTFTRTTELSLYDQAYEIIKDTSISNIRRLTESVLSVTYSYDEISKTAHEVAERNEYDSAIQKLESLQWDGVPRIGKFNEHIMKTTPSQYADALSMYTWVALAGRILHPGAKADIAPIFISPNQGTGKSSAVRAMALVPEWYGELDLLVKDDDLGRKMVGRCVIELPELRGLSGRESASTKAFLTQQSDSWVPKYKEFAQETPRRSLFIGTDNHLRVLTDPTGNRRWAPIRVAVTAEFCDHPTLTRDIEQYWAEAAHIARQFPTPEMAIEHYSAITRKLAEPYVRAATVADGWASSIDQFMIKQPSGGCVSMNGIAAMLGISIQALDHLKCTRIRNVMTMAGYEEVSTDVWRAHNKDKVVI